MGALILPSRFNQQPQQPVQVDAGHPLARGLVVAMPLAGQGLRDAVAGAWTLTQTSPPVEYAASSRGRGLHSGSGRSAYVSRVQPASITNSATQPITLLFRLSIFTLPGSGITGALMSWASAPGSGSPRYYARLAGTSATTANIEFYYSTSGGVYRTPTAIARGEHIIIHTFDGTTHNVYIDGVNVGSFTGSWTLDGGSFFLGNGFDGAAGDFLLSDFAAWNRGLSASEARSVSANPYQIYAAQPRRLWSVAAAASNAYTLPAAQGSYTITGNAAGLRVARRLATSAGAYSLTGNAAVLGVARRLIAAPGAYSITGSAANLVKGTVPRVLQAVGGSYVITGKPAALRAARRLQAAPGAYAITGFAVADRVSPVVTISVRFDTLPRNFGLKTIHFSH